MANFAFIHGAGDVGWYWHLVEAELRSRGHDTVAMDLPADDDSAGLSDYADVVVDAIGDRRDVVLVAQSLGGYTAPIVAERVPTRLVVLVAGMVPSPAESAQQMLANTGYKSEWKGDHSTSAIFYHDVPPTLAKEAMARSRRQSETPGQQAWPLPAWPKVPTRFLVCRNDRMFPAKWLRQVVQDRLGVKPDEISSGHTPALSRPRELAQILDGYLVASRSRSSSPPPRRGDLQG